MNCDRCGKSPTVYGRPIEVDISHKYCRRQYLCADCYCLWFEQLFFYVTQHEGAILPKDKVLVALSGGKDSQCLLTLLAKYHNKNPFNWIAGSVDEGIEGYRSIGLDIASSTSRQFDLSYLIISYHDVYQLTLDQMITRIEQNSLLTDIRNKACSLCGKFRIALLADFAKNLGCNIVATGRNLDDFIADTLLSICVPQKHRQLKYYFSGSKINPDTKVRIINPLWKFTDKEIALYCQLKKIKYQLEPECPYSSSMLADTVRKRVQDIEGDIPGFRNAFTEGIRQLQMLIPFEENTKNSISCSRCNSKFIPKNNEHNCPQCQFYELIEKIGGKISSFSSISEKMIIKN